jgi:outer membrane protein
MNKAHRPLPGAAALALVASLGMPATAHAQDWLVRVRAIDVDPNASSSLDGLDAKSQWAPEVDFSYFFTKNIAAELILATTRHEITLNGNSLGKVSVLPPTITLQYHFTDLGAFKPYVGGGLNLTWFYNNDVKVGNTPIGLDSTSVGGALQAGLDYEFQKNWYFNLDYKYIWMSTDVKAAGATLTNLKLNPNVFGIGVGYRF